MNAILTIKNHGASSVVLNTVTPSPLELTVPPNDSIIVSLPDSYLNQLISQCAKRGLAYDLRS
jgi:hypothetical protein